MTNLIVAALAGYFLFGKSKSAVVPESNNNNVDDDIRYCIAWNEDFPKRFHFDKYLCIKDFEKAKEYISYRKKHMPHLCFVWKVKVKEIGSSDASFGTPLVKNTDAYYCSGEVIEKIQIN